jgi:AcrR family transcriptional regulator
VAKNRRLAKPRRVCASHDHEPAARLSGNTKVTRDDWLNMATDLLVSQGVAEVKVQSIGNRLGVSRSSFYWYFKSRKDLLDALLKEWQQGNTGALLRHAAMPADTITAAVCHVFRCWIDERLFNHALDFAIREWARRDGAVRRIIDQSDAARVEAFTAMFVTHEFEPGEAEARARILCYMQVGYYALELSESLEERLKRVPDYLLGFTGVAPRKKEVAALQAYARKTQTHG